MGIEQFDNEEVEIIKEIVSDELLPVDEIATELDPDPNRISDEEVKAIETQLDKVKKKQAENGEYGFLFRPNCKTCQFAFDDPHIHEIYLMTNESPTPVINYIREKYGKELQWGQVDNHMKEHFMPKYKEVDVKRKQFLNGIRQRIREKEAKKPGNRIAELHEILFSKIEELCIFTDIKNDKMNRENAKVVSQLSMTIKALYELEFKVLGLNESPEEQKKRIQNMFQAQLDTMIERIPADKRQEFMDYLQGTI